MSKPVDSFPSSYQALPDDAVIRTNLPDLAEVSLRDARETLARLHGTPLGDATQHLLDEIEIGDPIVAGFGSYLRASEAEESSE